jgi:hypothetical protein
VVVQHVKGASLGKSVTEYKMRVLIFSATFFRNILHFNENWASYGKYTWVFRQSTRYPCQVLIKIEFFFRQIFENTHAKFHDNPSIESRVVPCGRTERHKRTMTKLIVAILRNCLKRKSKVVVS